jgi:hypothetical protein
MPLSTRLISASELISRQRRIAANTHQAAGVAKGSRIKQRVVALQLVWLTTSPTWTVERVHHHDFLVF